MGIPLHEGNEHYENIKNALVTLCEFHNVSLSEVLNYYQTKGAVLELYFIIIVQVRCFYDTNRCLKNISVIVCCKSYSLFCVIEFISEFLYF